jgi:hypothetical protein
MGMVHGGVILDTLSRILNHSWFPLWMHMGEMGLSHSMLGGMLRELGPCFLVMRFTNLCSGFRSNYNRFVLFASSRLHIMVCPMVFCTIHAHFYNYLDSHIYIPCSYNLWYRWCTLCFWYKKTFKSHVGANSLCSCTMSHFILAMAMCRHDNSIN